ncbi:hypothetical protein [Thermococcus henrietii]|uniref:hypothetical protein n=1 Tax=Thermococcus henrietii TaxID=2016361 RepID=UPI000C07B5BB|nr:hypothetical protein [Thermococcus henrietii]
MWSKLENGDFLFWFAVAIVMILAVIAGIMWGIQYVGPLATLGTVIILAFQAWCNKQTAEIMREQAGIMRQNMILSLKKEHTAQLQYKAIEPLNEIFSRLKMENNKLRVETPKESGIEVTTVDASSLLNGNLENNEDAWRLQLIAFATSVNPNLDVHLLYDLVKYHLPEKIIAHFKGLVLATANSDESSFNEHLNNIKGTLNAFRTFIMLSDECPYIKGAMNKNEISVLIEQVQKLRENIKIETKKKEKFYY